MIETILYAEDNENDVFLMQQAFRKIDGVRVLRTVMDGQEAVAYLRGAGKYADRAEFPFPGLLLLDVKMPRMNGFEVLEWVRRKSAIPHLPVVMFTSSLEDKDRARAYSLGANSFLVKPSDPSKFLTMLQIMEHYWLRLNQPSRVEVMPEPVTV